MSKSKLIEVSEQLMHRRLARGASWSGVAMCLPQEKVGWASGWGEACPVWVWERMTASELIEFCRKMA